MMNKRSYMLNWGLSQNINLFYDLPLIKDSIKFVQT
jgi:hypothetical protein